MRIGLVDVDGHNYPNLPLMKLSAWHKQRGDHVEWEQLDTDVGQVSKGYCEHSSLYVVSNPQLSVMYHET